MNENEIVQQQLQNQSTNTDIAFLNNAEAKDAESILSKHLHATELLEQIEKLLMGYEFDSETEEYKKIKVEVQDPNSSQVYLIEQGPVIDPQYVRMTIGYLKTFLNSNVYLSTYDNAEINNIMWDVNNKLLTLLHPLKSRYDPKMIDVIWSMIDNPIYSALKRATDKTTLNAMSKMQHSIEHLTPNSQQNQQQNTAKKPFKLFGF